MKSWHRAAGVWMVSLAAVGSAACSSPVGPSEPPVDNLPTSGTLVGAGDISRCGVGGMDLTASLLDTIDGTVFTAGDNAYMSGTFSELLNCYEPHWGRHKARTRPTAGNHDYETAGAVPYYGYFGAAAGPAGLGYYSYTVGPWLILALNSEIDHGAQSTQITWLSEQLENFHGRCAAAIWHRPLFTSGPNGNNPDTRTFWHTLQDHGVDVVINGHDHIYERFAPQDSTGHADPVRGIRQFTIGTGGVPLYRLAAVQPNSEVRGVAWGVGVFHLGPTSYSWEFRPANGFSFTDSGTGECH